MASSSVSKPQQVVVCRKVYFSCGLGRAGHDFCLEARVSGEIQPKTSLVLPLSSLKDILNKLIEPLEHKNLNHDLIEFRGQKISIKQFSEYLFTGLKDELYRHFPKNHLHSIVLRQGVSSCLVSHSLE